MWNRHSLRRVAALVLGLGLSAAGGCKTYNVDVALSADGSGHRTVEISTDSDLQEGGEAAIKQLRQLFDLPEKDGWLLVHDSAGKTTGFKRVLDVPTLDAWSRLGTDIHIRGTLVRGDLSNVELSNNVLVELGEGPQGHSLTYRESYTWSGLKEALMGFIAERFRQAMAQAYPALGPADLAELRGLCAGHLLQAWPTLIESDEADDLGDEICRSVAESALPMVRKTDPGADSEAIATLLENIVQDEDSQLDTFTEQKLPGVDQAVTTDLKIRVAMPGTIVDSNADSIEDNVASWEFAMTDLMKGPTEIFVKSEWIDEPEGR